MKKVVIFSILLSSLFLNNCSKEELEYSCDPKVNQWVIDNKLKYANATRTEFAQFTLRQQVGIYRSFRGEQKIKLWKEKFDYLFTTQNLSDIEKNYLLKLLNFAKPYHFDDKKGVVEFNKFASEWEKEVRSKLGWTDKNLFLYVHTLMTIEEFNKADAQKKATAKTKSGSKLKSAASESSDCECYYSIYCGLTGYCDEGGCNKVSGCGILGNSNCTGTCD